MGWTKRRSRGQSMVEFAISLPVLMLLVLGTVDIGRGFHFDIEITNAARQGVRDGIIADSTDIGDAVRAEPNSAIADTIGVWGDTAKNQPNGCTPNTSTACGDPNGCPASAFSGNRQACFAIRTCTLSGAAGSSDLGTCLSYGPWQSRPEPGGGHGLQVLVVYKLAPITPVLSQFTAATGNNLYLKTTAVGNELYF